MKSLNILIAVVMVGASSAGFASVTSVVHEENVPMYLPCGKLNPKRLTANTNPQVNVAYNVQGSKGKKGEK